MKMSFISFIMSKIYTVRTSESLRDLCRNVSAKFKFSNFEKKEAINS